MKEPVLISELHLYIINQVRLIRFNLNLTQKDVSKFLNPNTDNNILGQIESSIRTEKYTDEQLIILAKEFSKIDPKKNYTQEDFLPKAPMEEKLVEKIMIELPQKNTPTNAIISLLDNNSEFLNDWKSNKEITTYCNQLFDSEWSPTDFTSAIKNLVKSEQLRRKSEDEALFKRA